MTVKKRSRSLKLSVLITLGVSLAVFLSLFFYIFRRTMEQMVLDSETRFMSEQADIVRGVLVSETRAKEIILRDIAQWRETAAFVLGENPDYMLKNWHGAPISVLHGFDILAFKNIQGGDIFIETAENASFGTPSGISEYFTYLVGTLRDSGASPFGLEPDILSGITLYNNMPYQVFCALVPDYDGGGDAGAVIAAIELSGEYLSRVTHLPDSTFSLSPAMEGDPGELELSRLGDDLIEASFPLEDIHGDIMRLTLISPRTAHHDGMARIGVAVIALIAIMAVFAACMYLVFTGRILGPLGRLSRDIHEGAADLRLDSARYPRSREFETLCESINDMTSRLNDSAVSLEAVNTILGGMDALIYVTDPETGEILFANDDLIAVLGASGDIVGRTCAEVIRPFVGDEDCSRCPVPRMRADGEAVHREVHSASNGRYYRHTDRLIEWLGGSIAHLACLTDITAEKEAVGSVEKRLEQQELMSKITQSFISPTETSVLMANALRMTGEFLGASKIFTSVLNLETGALDVMGQWHNPHEAARPVSLSAYSFRRGDPLFDAFIRKNKPYLVCDDVQAEPEFEFLAERGVKSFIAIPLYVMGSFWGIISIDMCRARYVWSESDIQLVRLIGSVISGVITRRSTEETLLRMSSIVNSSPQFIAYIGHDGAFQYMNHGVVDISGYTAETLTRSGISLLFDEKTREEFFNETVPGIVANRRSSYEAPINRGDGEQRILLMSGFTTDDEDGVAIIASDVTETRKLERELIEAKEQAEQSSRAKGDFLSRMSHEMRTPMNAIIGMTQIARGSDDPDRRSYCLDKIDEASRHLLGVINDILDMSKIEAEKFELNHTDFEFEKMLGHVINVTGFRAQEKEQKLLMEIDSAIPHTVRSDEQRLAQVLTNLLSNAVKFTPEGGSISVGAHLLSEADGVCVVRFDVSDTGIGITEEQQSRLFRSFEQADGGISRRFGGTGLGLAISKSIVELMGGEIWADSAPGEGSTFSFKIPVLRAQRSEDDAGATQTDAEDEPYFPGKRVLLAEDVPINREIVLALLEPCGLSIDCAQDGLEAVAMFEGAAEPYDLIFMDIHMPEVDGYEATRRIRTLDSEWAGKVPICAMTANVFREDIERCLAAGMNDHIGKPISYEEIVATLKKYLS